MDIFCYANHILKLLSAVAFPALASGFFLHLMQKNRKQTTPKSDYSDAKNILKILKR